MRQCKNRNMREKIENHGADSSFAAFGACVRGGQFSINIEKVLQLSCFEGPCCQRIAISAVCILNWKVMNR